MANRIRVAMALGACFASVPAFSQADDVRFGNLHAHTSYSDGTGTPAEAYKMACDTGLDFFAITEHNHDKGDGKGVLRDGKMIAVQPELYSGQPTSLIETANRLNKPGECVTIYGQEYSTISSGNHMNVFDIASVIDAPNGEFDKLAIWLTAHPDSAGNVPLAQFNHPESGREAVRDYGRDDFGGGDETKWVQSMAPFVSLIEVLNAPALKFGEHQPAKSRESLYFRYLNLGFHLAPSVGQDNHTRNWGTSTDARVAVIAPEFTREGIISALRSRHAYATEDPNLRIVFRSGAALQGDITEPPEIGKEFPLSVVIVDDDEPNASYRIDVFRDAPGGKPISSPVETFEVTGNQATPLELEGIVHKEAGEYVLLRITQFGLEEEGDDEHVDYERMWTAPIWFETDSFHEFQANRPKLEMISMVPDPSGEDAENEKITFKNGGSIPLDMKGWKVRDLSENVWELDSLGTIAADEQKELMRNGADMSLNNNGDEIELVAPDGVVIQTITYGRVSTDEVVTPGANH